MFGCYISCFERRSFEFVYRGDIDNLFEVLVLYIWLDGFGGMKGSVEVDFKDEVLFVFWEFFYVGDVLYIGVIYQDIYFVEVGFCFFNYFFDGCRVY